ncbi:hypothetical protein RRG08_005128 [Elysia crispata]|uniref:Uncharacterized protein n=1 Tax=Elysia crispata TaxID=231223 RepID=A0AAE0ZI52_9GAST|nr:hypothetical protein RRG08_005128 [Elysia crispata]
MGQEDLRLTVVGYYKTTSISHPTLSTILPNILSSHISQLIPAPGIPERGLPASLQISVTAGFGLNRNIRINNNYPDFLILSAHAQTQPESELPETDSRMNVSTTRQCNEACITGGKEEEGYSKRMGEFK